MIIRFVLVFIVGYEGGDVKSRTKKLKINKKHLQTKYIKSESRTKIIILQNHCTKLLLKRITNGAKCLRTSLFLILQFYKLLFTRLDLKNNFIANNCSIKSPFVTSRFFWKINMLHPALFSENLLHPDDFFCYILTT